MRNIPLKEVSPGGAGDNFWRTSKYVNTWLAFTASVGPPQKPLDNLFIQTDV